MLRYDSNITLYSSWLYFYVWIDADMRVGYLRRASWYIVRLDYLISI